MNKWSCFLALLLVQFAFAQQTNPPSKDTVQVQKEENKETAKERRQRKKAEKNLYYLSDT